MLDKENSRKKFAFRREKDLGQLDLKLDDGERKKNLIEKTSRLTKCQKKMTAKKGNCGDR